MASFFLFLEKSVGEETDNILFDSLEEYDGDDSPDYFYVDDNSGCRIISDSRIDYKRELAGELGVNWDVAKGFSDSKLILFAYLKWKEACLSHLYGDFSFVIWNPGQEEILCARDHLGCKPFYYVDEAEFLAVASRISAFRRLPGFRFKIKEQYILDSMCSIVRKGIPSAYEGINRLQPAHYLKLTKGQSSGQSRYWDLQTKEDYQGLTLEDASHELKHRFIEAVRQRSQTDGHIGVELSGGLDSSGIASVLTTLTGKNAIINAFTHSISSEGAAQQRDQKNEVEFSAALVDKYSSIKHFKITEEHSEGSYTALLAALHSLYKPINQHYAMNSDLLFEMAGKSGTSIIYSGLGGDEGITNQGNGYVYELIRNGQHSKLRTHVKGIVFRRGGHFYWKMMKVYIYHFAPWVFDMFKKDWRRDMYRSFAIQKSLARKYRMKRRFFHTPSLPSKPDVRAMQYFRIMLPHIPERIEETSLLAQQHEIGYRYPYLDVKLLEFFYSLPSEYKFKDGLGRYLFRLAMEGMLPDKIRMRTDKSGNTIPNVFARVLKDEDIFRENIEEGRLKNHYHYVDYDKLHKMLDSFKKMGELKRQDYDLRAFQSAMSVLILQKWQREGKVDIGIKC